MRVLRLLAGKICEGHQQYKAECRRAYDDVPDQSGTNSSVVRLSESLVRQGRLRGDLLLPALTEAPLI